MFEMFDDLEENVWAIASSSDINENNVDAALRRVASQGHQLTAVEQSILALDGEMTHLDRRVTEEVSSAAVDLLVQRADALTGIVPSDMVDLHADC